MKPDKSVKLWMLALARNTIYKSCGIDTEISEQPIPGNLPQPGGLFVTLHKHGQLRGCIGLLESAEEWNTVIPRMARAAAFEDPRFPAVKKEEISDLEIEISLLTPMERITGEEDVVCGKHGLYIILGYRSGLLLPQVAVEQNWDRTTFLEKTCWKAGLPEDSWKTPECELYRFSALVFSEKDM